MQNIELKAKNIIISGLGESADCSDKDLAMNLFSTEFAEQPNIVLIRRLSERDLTDDRKVRPLLIHLTTLTQLNTSLIMLRCCAVRIVSRFVTVFTLTET